MVSLEKAVAWLEEMKEESIDAAKKLKNKVDQETLDDFEQTAANCRTLLDALRDLKEDQRRGNQKIKELSMAYGKLQAENAQLKAKLDAVRAECNKPIMTTSDVFGGGIASGHNILKRNILAIIDKEADT